VPAATSKRSAMFISFIGSPDALQFLGEDRYAEIARLRALHDAELQHLHDLFHRRPCLEGALDVAARAGGVHVRVGGVERDARPPWAREPRCRKFRRPWS